MEYAKFCLVYLFLVLKFCAQCQDLLIRAAYYDEKDSLYLIEEKYSTENRKSSIYLLHEKKSSQYVLQEEFLNKDTLILLEKRFNIEEADLYYRMLFNSTGYTIAENEIKDSATISFFEFNHHLGDTTIASNTGVNLYDELSIWKKERLQKILNGELTINTDFLKHIETIKAYFVNGIPLKIYQYTNGDKLSIAHYCQRGINSLTCQNYYLRDTLELYALDTFSWNSDTTLFSLKQKDNYWNEVKEIKYSINGKSVIKSDSTSKKETITYIHVGTFFKDFLFFSIMGDGWYFKPYLKYFGNRQVEKIDQSDGKNMKYKYSYDDRNRIMKQISLKGKKVINKVLYLYP